MNCLGSWINSVELRIVLGLVLGEEPRAFFVEVGSNSPATIGLVLVKVCSFQWAQPIVSGVIKLYVKLEAFLHKRYNVSCLNVIGNSLQSRLRYRLSCFFFKNGVLKALRRSKLVNGG